MTDAVSAIVAFLPERWKPWVLLGVLLLVVGCKVLTVVVRPPSTSSRWAGFYAVANTIGLNVGWAVNAYRAGRSAVMVPTAVAPVMRTEVAERLQIPREATKP